MRVSQVIVHIRTTSSFGRKMKIENIVGNRKGATVFYFKHLCFSKERLMRFSRGNVVFFRVKISSKTPKVAM